MDSIILKDFDIRDEDMFIMISDARFVAESCKETLAAIDVDGSNWRSAGAVHRAVIILLQELENALNLLAEEAERRQDEAEAAAKSEAKGPLPHMMEQALANLEAERSGRDESIELDDGTLIGLSDNGKRSVRIGRTAGKEGAA